MPEPSQNSKRRYRLTEAGRAALRKSVETHRPWGHSTGPRTKVGKVIASRNPRKHGYYSAYAPLPNAAAFKALAKSLRREVQQTAKPPRDIGPPVWG